MKQLYLVRHAKSSWDFPDLDDFDRPLSARGERDAPKMGKRFKEREITPDLVVTSPAVRARTTCDVITETLGLPQTLIKEDEDLYHSSDDEMFSIVRALPDKHDKVMMFGHNPGFTDFVNSLIDEHIDNIPTAGMVGIRFKVDSWKDIKPGGGQLAFFDFPKKHQRN